MRALITGASSGIGRDIAKELSQKGYDLILVARNLEKLNEVKEKLETNIETVSMDISNPENCKQLYEKYKDIEKLKDIDFIEYVKQKEILFIKEDIQKVKGEKTDYSRIVKYYKRKLVDYGVMKEIRSYKTKDGKYIKSKVSTIINEYATA